MDISVRLINTTLNVYIWDTDYNRASDAAAAAFYELS